MAEIVCETKLEEMVQKAMEKWEKDNLTESSIEAHVNEKLNERKDELILKLLGMDNHWGGRWELDHCNGRDGNSILGQTMKKLVDSTVEAWLIKNIKLPKLTASQIKALKSEYEKEYIREIEKRLRDIAKRDAAEYVEVQLDTILMKENKK